MKKKRYPAETPQIEYERGFQEGRRIGRIEVTREFVINCLKKMENGQKISKSLLIKINRETDQGFLYKALFDMIENMDTHTLSELEALYDTIIRSEEEIENEKFATYSID